MSMGKMSMSMTISVCFECLLFGLNGGCSGRYGCCKVLPYINVPSMEH